MATEEVPGTFLVSKEIEFDAGHRVPDHNGKCANPHGHRYRIRLSVIGGLQAEGSRTGMVLDFAEIKQILQDVHDAYDHGFVYRRGDLLVEDWVQKSPHLRWIPVGFSPTAENFARFIYEYCRERFVEMHLPGVVAKVEVWETPTSKAVYPVVATLVFDPHPGGSPMPGVPATAQIRGGLL